jgi:hypothetical protein
MLFTPSLNPAKSSTSLGSALCVQDHHRNDTLSPTWIGKT